MGVILKYRDIISFECETRLNYNNCEVVIKRRGKVLDITFFYISGKGNIVEINETFVSETEHPYLLGCLNKNIDIIENIYQKVMTEGVRNDSKIEEFG